jgi:hypothetical protein
MAHLYTGIEMKFSTRCYSPQRHKGILMNIYIEEKLAQQRQHEMLRAAQQRRLANVVTARLPAQPFALRTHLGDLFIAARQGLKALANAF